MKETFSVQCDWCRRDVISFVNPPAMVGVLTLPDGEPRQTIARICLYCYTELVKFIANQRVEEETCAGSATDSPT